MAVELTLVLRFEDPSCIPDTDDIENDLDCIELRREEEEV